MCGVVLGHLVRDRGGGEEGDDVAHQDPGRRRAFELLAHKADTLDIPLEPMTFVASPGIASFEHWDETAAMLRVLDDR